MATATAPIYPLSLHDALPISVALGFAVGMPMGDIVKSFEAGVGGTLGHIALVIGLGTMLGKMMAEDRKSTRLNSSHVKISYAVFCLKKKNTPLTHKRTATSGQ